MEATDTPPDEATSARRTFLKAATGVLTLLWGLVVTPTLIGSLVGPSFRVRRGAWIRAATVSSLPIGLPVDLRAADAQVDAYVQERVVRHLWAVRHGGVDVTVFSPICPHLGCHYNWNPISSHFECPCHGSVYSLDGKLLGGPAPRGLDTLPTRVENGALYVEWVQFKSGIPEKSPV